RELAGADLRRHAAAPRCGPLCSTAAARTSHGFGLAPRAAAGTELSPAHEVAGGLDARAFGSAEVGATRLAGPTARPLGTDGHSRAGRPARVASRCSAGEVEAGAGLEPAAAGL